MPRFVILHHLLPEEHPRDSHWDLMFESGDVLRTWALAVCPDPILGTDTKKLIRAEKLPDHRLAYLEYEGPVSENRGSVTQWDAGEYELLDETTDRLELSLHGQQISGNWVLIWAGEQTANYWLFGRS